MISPLICIMTGSMRVRTTVNWSQSQLMEVLVLWRVQVQWTAPAM
jgi:hypothetical protein